ncbi:SPOR domain-containing protein [Sediminibacterium soli]|uniref:SPOR domain-containing protein n=1 Tax=Sediminibacterium soli TaxID=2698829 RepID=UPI00137B7849|nr:SPOR domain-containing protein [Sediminibacterium soli]NCI47219.1 SPOR domain-containing protein [Sediminibacterium soli]
MKPFRQSYTLLLILLISSSLYAGDTVIVKKDPRLDILAGKQAEINKRFLTQAGSGLYKGFRIQVLSTASRDNAFSLQATLGNSFPEQKSYVTYQSPNFRVRIGNFLKREDAEAFRKQLLRYYPEGLYIVDDAVELIIPETEEPFVQ